MLLAEAFANERVMGKYEDKVSLIRNSLNKFDVQEMADVFQVSENDCVAVINCINEHPDWDNERIAEEIYWED